jgi:hypothetical protein
MIAKIFETYVSMRNLDLYPGINLLFPKEGAFSLKNLDPSPRKIHCSLGKLYFSAWNFSYFIGKLFRIGNNLILKYFKSK